MHAALAAQSPVCHDYRPPPRLLPVIFFGLAMAGPNWRVTKLVPVDRGGCRALG